MADPIDEQVENLIQRVLLNSNLDDNEPPSQNNNDVPYEKDLLGDSSFLGYSADQIEEQVQEMLQRIVRKSMIAFGNDLQNQNNDDVPYVYEKELLAYEEELLGYKGEYGYDLPVDDSQVYDF